MKKLMLKAGFVAVLAGILAACTPAQSELTTESVKAQATIIGFVKYNTGAAKDPNVGFTYNNYDVLPKAAIEVRIPYNSFGKNSQGNYSVTATANNDGYYEVTIPVASANVNVEVSVQPFTNKMGVADIEADKVNMKDALYPRQSSYVNLTPGDKVMCNLNVNGAVIE